MNATGLKCIIASCSTRATGSSPSFHPSFVRIEVRAFVAAEPTTFRAIYPDACVVEHPRSWPAAEPNAGVAVEEPLVIIASDEPVTQGYIEIIDAASGNRVVTVIEFLSPSNKSPGDGQRQYLQKQQEVLASAANLVEIDLTRAGQRRLAWAPERVPPSHRTTYQVCVRRAHKLPQFELYRAPLMRRLPVISIPLRASDADVPLDLQALIDQCYANGRYDDLGYRADPDPPLEADEAALAEDLLRGKGLR